MKNDSSRDIGVFIAVYVVPSDNDHSFDAVKKSLQVVSFCRHLFRPPQVIVTTAFCAHLNHTSCV